VREVAGPNMFTGSYGTVTAFAPAEVAIELADRFNTQWAAPGPISLASGAATQDPYDWWLRPALGKDHQPRDPRWRAQWPIQLLAELRHYGIAPGGIRLSRQGKGLWIAGAGNTSGARRAAAALHLEGSFHADQETALYRLGPVEDPSALTPGVAEAFLRGILRRACAQMLMTDPSEDHADSEAHDDFSSADFVLSRPEVRTFDGADCYVWLGEGGALQADGRPLLLDYELAATCGRYDLTVRVGAATDPAAPRAPAAPSRAGASRPLSYAAAAAEARIVAQPQRRAAHAAKATPKVASQPAAQWGPALSCMAPAPAAVQQAATLATFAEHGWQQVTAGTRSRRRRRPQHAREPAPALVDQSSGEVTDTPSSQRRRIDNDAQRDRAMTGAGPSSAAVSHTSHVVAPLAATITPVGHATAASRALQQLHLMQCDRARPPTAGAGCSAQSAAAASFSPHPPAHAAVAGSAAAGSAPAPSPALIPDAAATTNAPSPVSVPAPNCPHAPSSGATPAAPSASLPTPLPSVTPPASSASSRPLGPRDAFAERLLRQGLCLGRSQGDGNCLFRAISHQLHADGGDGHAAVRARVADYIRTNAPYYAAYFAGTAAEFTRYLAALARVGTEAGEPEVDAASKCYGRSVVLHQMTGFAGPATFLRGDSQQPPLQLAFSRLSVVSGHYDTVAYASPDSAEAWRRRVHPTDPVPVDADPALVVPATAAVTVATVQPAAPAAAPETSTSSRAAQAPAHAKGGMCAPTAIAEGLRQYCRVNKSAAEVQMEVTGSDQPRAWLPADFVRAARCYSVVLAFDRLGFASQSIGIGSASATYNVDRIYLRLHRNGSHVDLDGHATQRNDALRCSREADQYIDVRATGDDWLRGGLTVLRNVRAESGADGQLPRCLACVRATVGEGPSEPLVAGPAPSSRSEAGERFITLPDGQTYRETDRFGLPHGEPVQRLPSGAVVTFRTWLEVRACWAESCADARRARSDPATARRLADILASPLPATSLIGRVGGSGCSLCGSETREGHCTQCGAWTRPGQVPIIPQRGLAAAGGDDNAWGPPYQQSGYCGARAFARLTAVHPRVVQQHACGHDHPAAWGCTELLRAAMRLGFTGLDVHRAGHVSVRCMFAPSASDPSASDDDYAADDGFAIEYPFWFVGGTFGEFPPEYADCIEALSRRVAAVGLSPDGTHVAWAECAPADEAAWPVACVSVPHGSLAMGSVWDEAPAVLRGLALRSAPGAGGSATPAPLRPRPVSRGRSARPGVSHVVAPRPGLGGPRPRVRRRLRHRPGRCSCH